MNISKTTWIVGTVVLAALVLGWLLWPAGSTPQTPGQPVTLPNSGSIPGSQSAPVLRTSISMQDGTQAAVLDFIHNGTTISDSANAGRYLLAGNLGYCIGADQSKCQAASSTGFNIFYDKGTDFFSVGLITEPLSTARLNAEAFLEKALGISAQQLCALKYYVGTASRVNSFYDDRNLGFSVCPGATALPQ